MPPGEVGGELMGGGEWTGGGETGGEVTEAEDLVRLRWELPPWGPTPLLDPN